MAGRNNFKVLPFLYPHFDVSLNLSHNFKKKGGWGVKCTSPRYLVSGEKYAVRGFTVSTRVEHAQVVLAQQKPNGSVPVPKNRTSITTNSVLLTFILCPTVF